MLRFGDLVTAKPGTTSALWSEGRVGVVVGLTDPRYGGPNLVRWGDDLVLMGFNPRDVEKV